MTNGIDVPRLGGTITPVQQDQGLARAAEFLALMLQQRQRRKSEKERREEEARERKAKAALDRPELKGREVGKVPGAAEAFEEVTGIAAPPGAVVGGPLAAATRKMNTGLQVMEH